MTEGQHLMSGMQEVFTRAVNNTPEDQQDMLREDMSYLHKSWEQLSIDLNSVMSQLKVKLSILLINFILFILKCISIHSLKIFGTLLYNKHQSQVVKQTCNKSLLLLLLLLF